MELSWLQILVVVAMIQTEGKLLSAALKAEEENDSVGTAVGHGLVGPKTPAMSRRIAGERGVTCLLVLSRKDAGSILGVEGERWHTFRHQRSRLEWLAAVTHF